MTDNWEKVSSSGDIGSFGTSVTHHIRDTETGDVRDVTVWRGTEESENRQIGERIAEGWDDDDEDE
jgi:hypothetical protein